MDPIDPQITGEHAVRMDKSVGTDQEIGKYVEPFCNGGHAFRTDYLKAAAAIAAAALR